VIDVMAEPAFRTYGFSELDGVSRLLLIGDSSTQLGQRLQNLGMAGLLSHEQSFRDTFRLPPGVVFKSEQNVQKLEAPRGWHRLGLMATIGGKGMQRAGIRAQGSDTFWILCYDWNPRVGTAWATMLQAQDRLRPRGWSLAPQYVVPLIYLARMGDYPLRRDSDKQGRWIPHLAYAYDQTFPLLESLFSVWITEGTSQKAVQMRASMPPQARRLPADLQPVLRRFSALFGEARVNEILTAERPEPAIIRTLDQCSAELWSGSVVGVSPQDAWVQGLLVLALWQPEPPGPADEIASLPPQQISSAWRRFVAGRPLDYSH
jgi:hypothetical protein